MIFFGTVNQHELDGDIDVMLPTPSNKFFTSTDVISTVNNNKRHFSKREIEGAIVARQLQQTIGWTSTTTFISYIKNNAINNCTVSIDDVHRAIAIFGTPTPLLKGKMTRPTPSSHNIKRVELPLQIKQNYKCVHLDIDFLFVNKIPFFHSK